MQHLWIQQALLAFGFLQTFVKWVSILQSYNSASFYINNIVHPSFPIRSGTHQGDNFSGNLYVIGIEPLAIFLRANNNIIPAKLSANHAQVIARHVNDIRISTINPPSMGLALDIIKTFQVDTGMVVNYLKSFIINLLSSDLFGLRCIPDSGFKYLGLPTNTNGFYLDETSFITKASQIAGKLKNLHLTIHGFKLLFHSYILSSISYQLFINHATNSL